MFRTLQIENFAVARTIELRLEPGLTVFTGETGAGKSIVVDALSFVLGARRGREVVSSGAHAATVRAEAVTPDGRQISIERSIDRSGRSRARVNGEPITVERLQELGSELADIHGQSEALALFRPSVQLDLLDAFGGLQSLRGEVAGLVRRLRAVRRRLELLRTGERERARLLDQLRYEVEEITAAQLRVGEDAELREELSRLANVERLREDAAAALQALERSEVEQALAAVQRIADRDESAAEIGARGLALEEALADLRAALRDYLDVLEEDPERLAEAQERLDRIARLKRKYGETIEEVLAYADEAKRRLEELEGEAASWEELEAEERALREELAARAAELSRARRFAARELVRQVAEELRRLNMPHARLAVGFGTSDQEDGIPFAGPDYEVVEGDWEPGSDDGELAGRGFTESGLDRVEFLVSFNPGEALRPLARVASGGETSRFLLALTTVFGNAAAPRTIVLDEVDEGVGGRAGAVIGAALRRLAERHQVLCVTHLPQVAAFADHHFVVSKETDGERTWSRVRLLAPGERESELAAMLGGETETNVAAARELLAAAGR